MATSTDNLGSIEHPIDGFDSDEERRLHLKKLMDNYSKEELIDYLLNNVASEN